MQHKQDNKQDNEQCNEQQEFLETTLMNLNPNPLHNKNKLLVIGFYNRENLGDEAYKIAFATHFIKFRLTFVCIDDLACISNSIDSFDGIVVGGGDVFNSYFHNKYYPILSKFSGPKIALSVGIPFQSMITKNNLHIFDHVFTRNHEEVRHLQRVIGSMKAHYLPDFVFGLNTAGLCVNTHIESKANFVLQNCCNVVVRKKTCGVFLVNNIMDFPQILADIIGLLYSMSSTYNFVFYLFNTSNNHEENDGQISEFVLNMLRTRYGVCSDIMSNYVDTTRHSCVDMLEHMTKLDFAVCMRYHAHVFCMLANVPFVSISNTKKTRSLIASANLNFCQYKIALDNNGTPYYSNLFDMKNVVAATLANLPMHRELMNKFVKTSKFLLDTNVVNNLIFAKIQTKQEHVISFVDNYGCNDVDNAVRVVAKTATGCPDTKYNWGIADKLVSLPTNKISFMNSFKQSLIESLKYLLGLGSKEKDVEETKCQIVPKLPIFIDINEYESYRHVHRGGWYYAIKALQETMMEGGVYCDMYVDRTFHWASNYLEHVGKIPYTMPWCGFIHHTTDTTQSKYNVIELFKNKLFLQSLVNCKMLFVLSYVLADHVNAMLCDIGFKHIKVVSLIHPNVSPQYVFNYNKFEYNAQPKIIQIGSWLRNYYSMYALDVDAINSNPDNFGKFTFSKCILLGKNMNECKIPSKFNMKLLSETNLLSANMDLAICKKQSIYYDEVPCRGELLSIPRIVQHICSWIKNTFKQCKYVFDSDKSTLYIENQCVIDIVAKALKSVHFIEYLDNEEYDVLLCNNVVFIDLIDAAACNVVNECILRNTPILINRFKATEEMLGSKYPLFFESLDDIPKLLTSLNIYSATVYLQKLDKTQYSVHTFVNNFTKHIDFH